MYSKEFILSRASVAHACNPNYSGGRDQGTEVRIQPGKTVCEILYKKKPITKKELVEWLKCRA
jgi:hypothetical protein